MTYPCGAPVSAGIDPETSCMPGESFYCYTTGSGFGILNLLWLYYTIISGMEIGDRPGSMHHSNRLNKYLGIIVIWFRARCNWNKEMSLCLKSQANQHFLDWCTINVLGKTGISNTYAAVQQARIQPHKVPKWAINAQHLATLLSVRIVFHPGRS